MLLVLGAAVALALAAVGVAEVRGWPLLREPLQRRLADALGVPVRIDAPFRARLLGAPSVRAGHLRIGAGGGVPVPHLVEASDVAIAWRWADLWRFWRDERTPLRLQHVGAGELDAHLVRLADGRASWQLGRREAGVQPVAGRGLPRFGWLQVARGRIEVDDQPLATRLTVRLEGGEGDAAGGRREGYRAGVRGRWHALPLDLQLRAGAALPLLRDEADADGAAAVPLTVQGRAGAAQVAFDGRVGALLGTPHFDGAIRISGPSLGQVAEPLGLTLPRTPPFELRGRLAHAGGVWQLQAERAVIGRSRLDGSFRFDGNTRPPRLTGRLGGERLALADLAPALGVPTAPPAARPATARTRVLPERRFDLPSLAGMDADVQVAVAELDLGSDAITPLADLRAQVLLKDSVLQWRDLHAVVAGGRVDGSTTLDAREKGARWSADLRLEQIAIERWLPVLRKRQPAGGSWLSGTLSGRLQVRGQGRSTAEILSTLDGSAQALLRDGTLSHLATEGAGLDVAQALGVWIKGDAPLPLRCARVELRFERGVATLQRAVLDNADSTLRVAGRVNLRDESLALVARSRPKDFSPLSLRAPVTVSGTLAKPQVGIDGRGLAGKVIGSVVLGAVVAPLAALLPLVEPGSGEQADPCAGR